jgi:hypothetical protein
MNAFFRFRCWIAALVMLGCGVPPVASRAQNPNVGSVDFAGVPLRDALHFLWVKTREIKAADRDVVNIVLVDPDGTLGRANVTLKLNQVPWTEILRYTASLAGAETLKDGESILVGEKKTIEKMKLQRTKIVTNPGGEGLARQLAATMVIGAEFKGAPIEEVADFVRDLGAHIADSGERLPINILIKENGAKPVGSRTIDLALAGTNLHELLHLATGLAGCRFRIDARAIVIGESEDLARAPAAPLKPAGPIYGQLTERQIKAIDLPPGTSSLEMAEAMREFSGVNCLSLLPEAVTASRVPLRQVSVLEWLRYFNEASGTGYRLDPNAVVIVSDPAVKDLPKPPVAIPARLSEGADKKPTLRFDP